MHHIDESYQGDIEVDLLYLIQGLVSLTRKDLNFEFVTNCHQLTFNVIEYTFYFINSWSLSVFESDPQATLS